MTADKKPALWTPGDWNAFFGFGTNILVNPAHAIPALAE
jgi:AGZA family xanthine/uracil permease-like MFS transporter